MPRIRLPLVVLVSIELLLSMEQSAFALPTYGANCASCHTGGAQGTITITGNDTTANPTEACSVADQGVQSVFVVTQGSSRALTATLAGLSTGTNYALVVKGFESDAVHNCGVLAYSDDPAWNKRSTSPPVYYTQPLSTLFYTWPASSTFSFNLVAGAGTPVDHYDLIFATAGMTPSGTLFYTQHHLYVQVVAPAVPTISLSPTSLAPSARQGSNPPNGSFTVANTGSGTLNYTITDNATWLAVSPTGGSTSGPPVTHTVQYTTSSMAAGNYSAVITVSATGASNNPQTIAVTLTITPLLDLPTFVNVLRGTDTNPAHIAAADMDGNGVANGLDIQPYVRAMLGG